ncbi:DUF6415 family natural product biosynthesis protein [Streptomyces melanogenes]|uniref:DUF6415 family natural product biosynthesis protein n=1 Tax=Streptomyces melanogenes TaxID=67326 RepID=UPI00167ED83A|nr:DUF6415 family natural product biosynthesis protein [Streptomyces melanogenes]GGP59389.1 hypothetical protein GCM10010278_40650 [Streptomyces melanogenes]
MTEHTRIAQWLASAHDTPSTAWLEWSQSGAALLPTGRVFDALRISAAIIHAAAQSGSPDAVAVYLARVMDGPVIHDPYAQSVSYFALVPVGACTQHDTPDVQRLAPGTWLGVPDVPRTARPGTYWIRPPRRREDLCVPAGVDQVVRVGRQRSTAPGADGSVGLDLDGIKEECEALLRGTTPNVDSPSLEDATESTLRARGHLMLLLPALQDAEARLLSDDPVRSRVLLGVTEAHRQLGLDSSSVNLARQYAHMQRLARCCLGAVDLLRALGASAVSR